MSDLRSKREEMVRSQIVTRGVRDPRVLEAMRAVPREAFVPPELAEFAYSDSPLPIESQQTISQPYIVALMTEGWRSSAPEVSPDLIDCHIFDPYAPWSMRRRAIVAVIAALVFFTVGLAHSAFACTAAVHAERLGQVAHHAQSHHCDGDDGPPCCRQPEIGRAHV